MFSSIVKKLNRKKKHKNYRVSKNAIQLSFYR